jgi:hypothetical protein
MDPLPLLELKALLPPQYLFPPLAQKFQYLPMDPLPLLALGLTPLMPMLLLLTMQLLPMILTTPLLPQLQQMITPTTPSLTQLPLETPILQVNSLLMLLLLPLSLLNLQLHLLPRHLFSTLPFFLFLLLRRSVSLLKQEDFWHSRR